MQYVLLSIEDNDADYWVIKMALEERGVPVQVCRVLDGEQGLLFLQRTDGYEAAPRPHLILLDINLPKKNGLDVLAHIRSTESLRSIPVVMFTSSSLEWERNKALALGAEDFISKPGTLDGLTAALSSVCSRFLMIES